MNRILPCLLLPLLHIYTLSAQPYITAAGIRLAMEPGITVQQRLAGRFTVEAMVQTQVLYGRHSMALQLQRHHKLVHRGLNGYIGAGPQLSSYRRGLWTKEAGNRFTVAGLALTGGVELAINRLLLSADYKPVVYLGGPVPFDAGLGLSVRYILLQEPKPKDRRRTKGAWPWQQNAGHKGARRR